MIVRGFSKREVSRALELGLIAQLIELTFPFLFLCAFYCSTRNEWMLRGKSRMTREREGLRRRGSCESHCRHSEGEIIDKIYSWDNVCELNKTGKIGYWVDVLFFLPVLNSVENCSRTLPVAHCFATKKLLASSFHIFLLYWKLKSSFN